MRAEQRESPGAKGKDGKRGKQGTAGLAAMVFASDMELQHGMIIQRIQCGSSLQRWE